MSAGANWAAGGASGLWHLNFKINTPDRGFNCKFHMAEVAESVALAGAADLALRLRYVMPTDSDIFYATCTKDDSKKDSRFVRAAIGAGMYQSTGPVDSIYDFARTAVLIRFEHAGGGSISRKFAPLPDDQVEEGELLDPPTDVVGLPVALPAAPTVRTAFKLNMEGLMKAIMVSTHHIVSGHAPGGAYVYYAWQNAFQLRVASKRGGRVFV